MNSRLPKAVRDWIDLLGHFLFLMPFVAHHALVTACRSSAAPIVIGEQSPNAGGLPQWPAKLLVPLGFFLLFVQGVSEIIKRVAVMRGLIADPHAASGTAEGAAPGHATLRSPSERRPCDFFVHNMAPIMFGSLVLFLLLGYPVAFALAANGLFFGLIGVGLGLFQPDFLQALPERVYGVMSNDTLLAIPFFTFMGLILERSGMAEDLLDTIGQLFGPIRGGLAYAVIFVGALLAATTGVVAASVISMGLISLPIMLRYGYDRRRRQRRHRRLGHAGPDHPALARADRHGRPARPLRRRHVPGRLHPRPRPGRPLRPLHLRDDDHRARGAPGPAAGGPHAQRAGRPRRRALVPRPPGRLDRAGGVGGALAADASRQRRRDPGGDRSPSASPTSWPSPTATSGSACSPAWPSRWSSS